MLNKYRYKNKVRYNLRKKNNMLLLWEKEKNNQFKTQYNFKKLKKINSYSHLSWRGNIFWKYKNMNDIIYKSACKYYRDLTTNFWKEKISSMDWAYHPSYIYKKRPFITRITNRKNFIDNILFCIKNKDSLFYLRNSLYQLLDNNIHLNQIFDVLNFAWLYVYKDSDANLDLIEKYNSLALNYFYKGFLKNGNKRICERKFLELLSMLKLKLKKASLHIMYFFCQHLKPLIGFRRVRLGKKKNKRQELRYLFKISGHNWRWQGLVFKRVCLNSPYYQKKTKYVSIVELYKGLLLSINSKGPIAKCLAMYYTLIGRRTPYVKKKKKKKDKSKSVRIKY